jgi:hypothetical protein
MDFGGRFMIFCANSTKHVSQQIAGGSSSRTITILFNGTLLQAVPQREGDGGEISFAPYVVAAFG